MSSNGPADLPRFRVGDPVLGPTRALRDDPLTALLEPYRRFGQRPFRMRWNGTDHVVVAGPEANDFAWSNSAAWDWHGSGAVFREQFGDRYLTQLTGAAHAEKRKRLAPAFRGRALQQQGGVLARVWHEALAEVGDDTVDLRALCKRLVVRMASQAILQVDLPDGAEDDISSLERDLLLGATLGPARRAWFARPAYLRRKRAFERLLGEIVLRRQADPSGDDLLSAILRAWPADDPPGTEELVADVVLLLQAGSESTAHQILWTLLLLAVHPDWREELRAEALSLDADDPGSWAVAPKLRATVLESERLRPAIPFAVRRVAEPLVFAGVDLPPGTPVLHHATLAHFLDDVYDEPFAFRPARFLDGGAPPPKAHGTFGGGPHVCLGLPLARQEVPIAVASVLRSTRLELVAPVSLKARMTGVVTPVEDSVPVRCRPLAVRAAV